MFSILSLAERLAQIIEPLRRAVAAHGGRHRADAPLVVLLWSYLHRVVRRFEALTLRTSKRRSVPPPKPATTRPPPIDRPRLPQRFGWLAQFGWEIRGYGGQLRHLIGSPEMQELLAVSPQAAKILRPLCRMLAIGPEPDLPPNLFTKRPAPAPPVASPSIDPHWDETILPALACPDTA